MISQLQPVHTCSLECVSSIHIYSLRIPIYIYTAYAYLYTYIQPTHTYIHIYSLRNVFFCFVHEYTLCFTGSPCYNVSYYNYISIWPYYIVIHFTTHTSSLNYVFLTYIYATYAYWQPQLCVPGIHIYNLRILAPSTVCFWPTYIQPTHTGSLNCVFLAYIYTAYTY